MQVFDQVLPSPTQSLNQRLCLCSNEGTTEEKEDYRTKLVSLRKWKTKCRGSERIEKIKLNKQLKDYSLRWDSEAVVERERELQKSCGVEDWTQWATLKRRLIALLHLNLRALRIITQLEIVGTCNCLKNALIESKLVVYHSFSSASTGLQFIAAIIFSLKKIRYT